MATGIFTNALVPHITRELRIDLYDYDTTTGFAVWQSTIGEDIRFVEGNIDDDIWKIIEAVTKAYDEEES